MNKKNIGFFVAIIAPILVCSGFWIKHAVCTIQEGHARSCLVVNAELADEAVQMDIPHGRYHEAIAKAEGIVLNYPTGAILPESHPYAKTYASERQKQLVRIARALHEATGMEYDTNWEGWKEALTRFGESKE